MSTIGSTFPWEKAINDALDIASPIKRALAAAAIATIVLGLLAPRAAKAQTYSLDDGTAESGVGLGAGGSPIFLNEFTITGGNNVIISISIAFGSPAGPDPTLNGLTYTAALWSDPNGDGLPDDAVLLASTPGVVVGADTNTFVISPIVPTTVLTPNFFVGFVITHAAGQFPAAIDRTAPTFPNRSFVDGGGDINDLSGAFPIEAAGASFVGNWMIRATAVPEPSTYALVSLGLVAMLFFGHRTRRVTR